MGTWCFLLAWSLAAPAWGADAPAPPAKMPDELSGALLGCDHVTVKGTAKPTSLGDVVKDLKTHAAAYCGQSANTTATFARLTQGVGACYANSGDKAVGAAGQDHDSRRPTFCFVLSDVLKKTADFCAFYRKKEIVTRLTVIEVMSPKNIDAWSADLRLKDLGRRINDSSGYFEKVQTQARETGDYAAANPVATPKGLGPSALALAKLSERIASGADAASKRVQGAFPAVNAKIAECKAKASCANGPAGASLKKQVDKLAAAPANCDAASAAAKATAPTAQLLSDDADKLKRGFAEAADTAKKQAAMLVGQQAKISGYLTNLHSLGEITKPGFQPAARDAPDITGLQKVADVKPTYYWDAEEKNLGEEKDHVVLDHDGKPIARVSERFYTDELAMEGTGKLEDGRVLNAAGKVNGQQTFTVLDSTTPYGFGVSEKYPLQPYQSIAVDPKVIPIGSEVYVPALRDMPYIDQNGVPRLHDGYLKAVDVGSAINEQRMDIFTGYGDQSYYFETYGMNTLKPTDVYIVSKPPGK